MALGAELKTVELYLENTKKILDSVLLEDCTADLILNIYNPAIGKKLSVADMDKDFLFREFEDIPGKPNPFSMFRNGSRTSKAPTPTHQFSLQFKAEMLIVFLSHMYRRFEARKKELEDAIRNESATT